MLLDGSQLEKSAPRQRPGWGLRALCLAHDAGRRQELNPAAGVPRWIYVPAAAGALFVGLPWVAMAVKVDWSHFWSLISSPSSTTALALSLRTAAASTA